MSNKKKMSHTYFYRRWPRFKRKLKSIVYFPRNKYYQLRGFYHRGKHGWTYTDCWDLDGYLARVMGESIAHLAETTHGWPGSESGWPTFEDWQNELRDVSKKLIAYNDERFEWGPEHDKMYKEAMLAIKRLSKYWGDLWD